MFLLEKLNKKVKTWDSQQQLNVPNHYSINDKLIDSICNNDNYKKETFNDVNVLFDIQRPYLELSTTNLNADDIFDNFKNSFDIGVTMYNGFDYKHNDTMLRLEKQDSLKFQTNDKVVLTYHLLNKPVTNNDTITTKYLTPTTFKLNDFWNYKVNQDNIKMFMVGFNSDVDINTIFDKVNNIV
jgi:uncharacterized protein (UPF0335 family)